MKPREINRRAEGQNGSVECGGMIGKDGKVQERSGNGGKVRRRNRSSRVEFSANLHNTGLETPGMFFGFFIYTYK